MAMDAEVSALTSDEFFVLRDILEELEDISMLADILHEACLAEDVTVLASAADTVCYHFSSLAAIGAHNDLFQSLLDGYRRIKAAELPAGAFIVSLITLGKRIPSEVLTVNYLNQELSRSYQNNAIAACSPVSDHMAGNHQFGDANFLDEFEQFLGTGNRMDEENMLKSFETLSEKLVVYEEFDPIQCARLNHLLSQLRTYNEKQFDVLMLKWVATLMKQKIRHIDCIIPPLLGSGCLTFEALFSVTRNATEPSMGTISSHPGPRMQLFNLTLSAFETFKMSMETVSTALPWLTRVLSRTLSLRVTI
jgi:mediator of RNA polymerase II transcription subunit 12, fungi type